MKMNKILIAGLTAVVGLTAWVSGVGATGATQSTETEVEVVVDDAILISSKGKVSINAFPTTGGAVYTGDDEVKVSVNSSTGYTLSIKDKDATLALVSSTTTTPIGPTTGTFGAPAVLGTDTWGYALPAESAFAGGKFTAITAADQQLKATAAAATGDITVVTFGANVTTNTDPGTYTDTVVYTAVVN